MCDYGILWHKLIDLNMTKRELAELADVSESTLNNMKNGRQASFTVLAKISAAVNIPIEELIKSNINK